MIVAPVLFFVGVVFTYIAVLGGDQVPAGLNGSQFNALVQAQPLYSFEVLTMAAIGLAFEMPLVLLRLRRGGHRPQHPHRALALRVRDHRRHRRGDAGSRPGDDRPGDRPAPSSSSAQASSCSRSPTGASPAARPPRASRRPASATPPSGPDRQLSAGALPGVLGRRPNACSRDDALSDVGNPATKTA